MLTVLVCPNCGGPWSALAPAGPFMRCTFCSSALSLESQRLVERCSGDDAAPPTDATERAALRTVRDADERERVWAPFLEALGRASGGKPLSFDTFRDVARTQLGRLADGDVLARVAYGLALEFERDAGCTVRDAMSLGRFAKSYVEAIETLRKAPSVELNMPFLTATDKGPVHYRRTVDVATLQTLAEREPSTPAPKRGFFGKLFG